MAHGSSDDGLCWTNLAKEFQDDYDIIMFDARGHGLSDPPTPSDAPDVQVEDLAGLIKELKLEQADSDGALDGQRIGRELCREISRRAARGDSRGPRARAAGHAARRLRQPTADERRATSSPATT